MTRVVISILLAHSAGWASIGPVTTRYLDLGEGSASCCLVADPAGNSFIAGSIVRHTGTQPDDVDADASLTKLDPNLKTVYQVSFGVGKRYVPLGMAIDRSGNVFIVGRTTRGDLDVNSVFPGAPDARVSAFIVKIEGATGRILFDTPIGGSVTTDTTIATAVAVDPAGNAYITGATNASDFPTTPDCFSADRLWRRLLRDSLLCVYR